MFKGKPITNGWLIASTTLFAVSIILVIIDSTSVVELDQAIRFIGSMFFISFAAFTLALSFEKRKAS